MKYTSASEKLVRRLESEIAFSENFTRLTRKTSWKKLTAKAAEIFDTALKVESLAALEKACKEIETVLAPVGKAAKEYTCWCVGHGHMDMNWMWNWAETVSATNDMFVTVLKLMDEFPEFRFSQSQTSVYEIMRKYNPTLFKKIQARVAEGRWEITASEWVEGDKNLASGESLARHMLYTRRYMAEHFGLKPENISIAWNPDTFGHAHTIPMIYTRGGVKRYYMCRGGEASKPAIFRWQSSDGSQLLVNLEHTWYNDSIGTHNVNGLLSFCEATGLKDWMLVYGVGDHGGGPTRRDLHLCIEMNSWPIYPNFKFATTQDYYAILEKRADEFPILDDELNYEFTGCYTSQSDIKKTNRLAECLLERAEFAAVLENAVTGEKYPHEPLREAWKATLLGHFHDILPGSGIKATREYHSGQFQNTAAATGMIITNSLRAVAGEIDTSFAGPGEPVKDDVHFGAGMGLGQTVSIGGISTACHVSGKKRGFVVFNPTASCRKEVITVTAWDAENDNVQTRTFVARMPDGTEIPAQRLDSGMQWGHRYVTLAVPVTVHAMGYSAFVLDAVHRSGPAITQDMWGYSSHDESNWKPGVANLSQNRKFAGYDTGEPGMENEFIRVRFNDYGGIVELTDKTTGVNIASPEQPTGLLEYILERPDGMSAWLIRKARERRCPLEMVSFKPTQFGPHIAAYEGVYKLNDSSIKVRYSLAADSPKMELAIEANWLERGGPQIGMPSLRLHLPFAVSGAVGRYEIPFGSIERKPKSGQEVPSQKFVDVTGKVAGGKIGGCAVLNDGKYGYCLDGSTLTATLLRSSYEPDPLPEYGKFEMKFALMPHGGKLSVSELMHAGNAYNQPLQVVATDIHKGRLSSTCDAAVKCTPDNVVVTGIKKAEDSDAFIVRLLETAGKTSSAKVSFDSGIFGKITSAVEVDLLEQAIKGNTAKTAADGFAVKVPANAIASIKISRR